MNDEFIEPTRRGRTFIILIVLATTSCMALFEFWVRPLLASSPPCEAIPIMKTVFVAVHCLTIATGAGFAFHAVRLLKYKQMPLPDAWVWHRTPVQRGRKVAIKAYAGLLCSAILIGSGFYTWGMLDPVLVEISQKNRCAIQSFS